MTSFHQRFLGKIYSVLFYLSVEDLSEENFMTCVHKVSLVLDFLVSSVQFSVNNKVTTTQSLASDAPSKLDNAKRSSDVPT